MTPSFPRNGVSGHAGAVHTDAAAVVDSVGAVRGLQNLRVVDASIIPKVPSTVTNLTTIMVAEHIYRRAYAR
jgi:choline dehydrogenase